MTPHKLNNSLSYSHIYFSIPSFFLAIGKEAARRWEIVQEYVGCVGATASGIITEANWLGFPGVVKRRNKNDLTHHPTRRMMRSLHHGIWHLYPK
jgi:hypothetical protein